MSTFFRRWQQDFFDADRIILKLMMCFLSLDLQMPVASSVFAVRAVSPSLLENGPILIGWYPCR